MQAVSKAHHEWERAADEALHVSDKAHLEAVANTAELRSALENLITAANSALKAVDTISTSGTSTAAADEKVEAA